MTAPLSDFMTQLMDESINRQTEGSTGNLYEEQEGQTIVSTTSNVKSDAPDGDSTVSSSATPLPPLENNTAHTTTSNVSMPSITGENTGEDKKSKTINIDFNASLTNFMNQLLSDSELDKLIQEGEAELAKGAAVDKKEESTTTLSKGAVNVLAGAMHAMQRGSERKNNKDNAEDAAGAGSPATTKNSRKRANKKKQNATKPQRCPPSENSVVSASNEPRKSAFNAAKKAAKDFWDSLGKIEPGDSRSLSKSGSAKPGAGSHKDLAKTLDHRTNAMQKSNSETSMSIVSNQKEMHKSSIQSLNISALQLALKKSTSLGQIRAEMTRMQNQNGFYGASSMDVDIDSDYDEDKNNEGENQISEKFGHDESEQNKPSDSDSKTDDSALETVLDASIDPHVKKRRPRSNTPRREKMAGTSSKKRAKSLAHCQEKSADLDTSKKRSASERRDRTTGNRRSSTTSKDKQRASSSRKDRTRSSSVSVRSSSEVKIPKRRSVSATPRAQSKDKPRRKSRRSSTAGMRDGSMKDISMKDRSMRDHSRKRDKKGHTMKDQSMSDHSRRLEKSPAPMKDHSRKREKSPSIMKDQSMRDHSRRREKSPSVMKDQSMKDHSRKREKSRARARKGMDESSKREGSTRRSRRSSATKPGESPKMPRKSPSESGHRSPSIQVNSTLKTPKTSKRTSSKETQRTPATPKTPRTPKTLSADRRTLKPASRSKSFDPSVETPASTKPHIRRTKTAEQVSPAMAAARRRNSSTAKGDQDIITASPAMPPVRRPNSMANKGESPGPTRRRNSLTHKGGEPATADAPKTPKEAPFRRVHTVGHGHDFSAISITLSARRRNSLTAAGLPATPGSRRTQGMDGSGKEPRVNRRTGVTVAKAPPRQKSDPVPTVQRAADLAAEAAKAAKEMEKRRARSKSSDRKSSRKARGDMDGSHQQQASKPTSRRGTRQRSNQQAQQVLRNALNEEAKAQENADTPIDPLAETPEGVKEAAWISRRKSRIIMAQQSHAPIASGPV